MAETLAQIRALARDLSNQQGTDVIDDATFNSYINNRYQNKMMSDLNHGLKRVWRLKTEPYRERYPVDDEYVALSGTARIDGNNMDYYVEVDHFFNDYPDSYAHEPSLHTGNGATVTFPGTLSIQDRIIPETVVFGDETEQFSDDGDGALIGSDGGSGTITYETGAYSITFNAAPADGDLITGSYSVYIAGVPSAFLYTNADTEDGGGPEIVLRPVPKDVYNVEIDYEARPTALALDTDVPVYRFWGDLIAYGTAIDVLERFGQFQEAQKILMVYPRIRDDCLAQMVKIEHKRRKIPRW